MLSLSDLALLSALPPAAALRTGADSAGAGPRRGSNLRSRGALATTDRLAALGLLRRVGARYALSREGHSAVLLALEEYRVAIEQMRQSASLRLVEEPAASDVTLAAG